MTSKRFSKDVVNKYLNLIKPKGLKRGNDKVRCSEQSHQFMFSPRKDEKKITVFKEVRKHLGKSRSSSSNAGKPVALTALRRDDSALQQQDGIQSAILHCKKSYNSPSQGCNVLSRSGSAPSHGSRISYYPVTPYVQKYCALCTVHQIFPPSPEPTFPALFANSTDPSLSPTTPTTLHHHSSAKTRNLLPINGRRSRRVEQDALDSVASGNFLDKIPRECLSIIESKSKVRYSRSRVTDIAAALEDKLDIRMNRFEKSLNEMKNSLVTPTAPLKAVTEVCVTCGSNHSYNQCPLTRGGNDFTVSHDNIQQFQTAAVGNFIQNRQNVSNQMRPPGFHQPTQQNNNQNRFQGNNLNQNRPTNQGAIYQNRPPQNPNFQAPPQQNTVMQGKFEAYATANDANITFNS
nr:probable membrane-associated kinase regulator 2 [Tanacetum cinerariifolium]